MPLDHPAVGLDGRAGLMAPSWPFARRMCASVAHEAQEAVESECDGFHNADRKKMIKIRIDKINE